MKNITLSAEEADIERAREKARKESTTLNELFRGWVRRYVSTGQSATDYQKLMARLEHVNSGGKYSRDEANER